MKAKEFVKQIQKLDKMIENKLIEKEQWKLIALSATAQSGKSVNINGILHNAEKVQSSSKHQDKMAEAVVKYMNIESEIDEYIDELIDRKMDVISVIEQLEIDEYDLLHKMYVGRTFPLCDGTIKTIYMTLKEIAHEKEKSYKWATQIHGRALSDVQRILNERKEHEN